MGGGGSTWKISKACLRKGWQTSCCCLDCAATLWPFSLQTQTRRSIFCTHTPSCDKGSCSPGWPRTPYIANDSPELLLILLPLHPYCWDNRLSIHLGSCTLLCSFPSRPTLPFQSPLPSALPQFRLAFQIRVLFPGDLLLLHIPEHRQCRPSCHTEPIMLFIEHSVLK